MGHIVDIGALADIPVRGARVLRAAAGCIAVFRTIDNQVFALDDRCPHRGGPLSQGIVHGRNVTCPLHNWVMSLETGEACGADQGHTRAYSIEVREGRLLLDLAPKGDAAGAVEAA